MAEQLPKDEPVAQGPVLYTYSKEQLIGRAQEFMRLQYGKAGEIDFDRRAEWHARLGLLVMFVEHISDGWNP